MDGGSGTASELRAPSHAPATTPAAHGMWRACRRWVVGCGVEDFKGWIKLKIGFWSQTIAGIGQGRGSAGGEGPGRAGARWRGAEGKGRGGGQHLRQCSGGERIKKHCACQEDCDFPNS